MKDKQSRKDVFLKDIEDKIDPKNAEYNERFLTIKNQILEKVKATKVSRERSKSGSRTGRTESKKRDHSKDSDLKE